MNTAEVTFGLIGCGGHSAELIIPALASIQETRCIWVCDPDDEAALAAAKRLNNPNIFCDWQAAIEKERPNCIICIATPQLHTDVARYAIENKIHIFVEKPPAIDLERQIELADLARAADIITQVGHNLRFSDCGKRVREICRSEDFGRHSLVSVRYHAPGRQGDRWNLGSSTKAFLLGHMIHAIDFLTYLTDLDTSQPTKITIDRCNLGLSIGLLFDLVGGGVGSLLATNFGSYFDFGVTVVSESGNRLDQSGLLRIEYFKREFERGWSETWHPKVLQAGPDKSGYRNELIHFFVQARGGRTSDCRADFASEQLVYEIISDILRHDGSIK